MISLAMEQPGGLVIYPAGICLYHEQLLINRTMGFLDFFSDWFSGKPIEAEVAQVPLPGPARLGRVEQFNKRAPWLFSRRLGAYGYHFQSIETFLGKDFIWTCRHIYFNEALIQSVCIEQAPYYSDYGFTVFLKSSMQKSSIVLCNVPHEDQDPECLFLSDLSDRFFSNEEILSLLRGAEWKQIETL